MTSTSKRLAGVLDSPWLKLAGFIVVMWLAVSAREADPVAYVTSLAYPQSDSLGVLKMPLLPVRADTKATVWDLVLVRHSRRELGEVAILGDRGLPATEALIYGSTPGRSTVVRVGGEEGKGPPYGPIIELKVPRDTVLGMVIASRGASASQYVSVAERGVQKTLGEPDLSIYTRNELRSLRACYLFVMALALVIASTLPKFSRLFSSGSRSSAGGGGVN